MRRSIGFLAGCLLFLAVGHAQTFRNPGEYVEGTARWQQQAAQFPQQNIGISPQHYGYGFGNGYRHGYPIGYNFPYGYNGYPIYGVNQGYGVVSTYGGYYGGYVPYGYSDLVYPPQYGVLGRNLLDLERQNLVLRQQIQDIQNNARVNQVPGGRPGVALPVPNQQNNGQAQANQQAPVRIDVALDRQRVQQERAQKLINGGKNLFKAGEYRKARDLFTSAVKATPNDSTLQIQLAMTEFSIGNYAGSASLIQSALKANTDWIENQINVKEWYTDAAEFDLHMSELGKFLKNNPNDRNGLYTLGFIMVTSGEPEKAKAIFERLARLETDDAHLKPYFDYFTKRAEVVEQPKTNQ